MAKSNRSVKNQKKQKKNQKNSQQSNVSAAVSNTNNPPKLSRDARRRLARQNEQQAQTEPEEESSGRFTVNVLTLKILLLLFTTVGIVGLLATKFDASVRSTLRGVGLMAIPISVFLMVEGFYHTRSRGRYFGRLFLWAMIAEVPAMLINVYDQTRAMLFRTDFNDLSEKEQTEYLFDMQEFSILDYLFTLVLCFAVVWIIDKIFAKFREEQASIVKKMLYGLAMGFVLIVSLFGSGVLQMLKLMNFPIIALMLSFFCVIFRGKKDMLTVVFTLVGLTYGAFLGPEGERLMFAVGFSLPAILVKMYNGKLGYNKEKRPRVRLSFYSAYASILAMSVLIAMIVFASTHGTK